MTAEYIQLAACVAGLELAVTPAWVFVADTMEFVWANDAALELWRAPNRAELLKRDVAAGSPEKVMARTRHVVDRVRAGDILREEWTFYPKGQAVMVMLDLRGVTLPDGRFGVLSQAVSIAETTSATLQRTVTMARHSSVISALIAADGRILTQNPAALTAFGGLSSWVSWISDAAQAQDILRRALAGESVNTQLLVCCRGEQRWHVVDVQALRDPVGGELGALVEHVDETARIEAESLAEDRGQRIDVLNAALELVEQQRREILELSAPILDVGGQTLAVPIIGRLGDLQSKQLMTRLLDAVSARGTRRVILDMTGVAAVDDESVVRLRQIVQALGLLGATPMITGIRAQLAQEFMKLDFDLHGVATRRSLAEGLRRLNRHGE